MTITKFDYNTYVVLDMPESIATHVKSIRKYYKSNLYDLPVEITVIGSSGIGVFHKDQNPKAAFEKLDQIAANTAPINTAFNAVTRFPSTGVFYYEPIDS